MVDSKCINTQRVTWLYLQSSGMESLFSGITCSETSASGVALNDHGVSRNGASEQKKTSTGASIAVE